MKYLPLLWATLWRRKLRTIFTMLSIVVAFLLFGLLQAVGQAFDATNQLAGANRLISHGKFSFTEQLPVAYYQQIKSMPGVENVTHSTWFGGKYQDGKTFFPILPVDQETYFSVYPEFVVPKDQLEQFKQTKNSCLVGVGLAKKLGWKIGDTIPVQATIWPAKGNTNSWQFQVVGLMTPKDDTVGGQENFLAFRYDYFDDARQFGQGSLGWYVVTVKDPAQSEEIARQIDARFANSSKETRTETDKAFNAGFAKQFGDIQFLLTVIIAASFFSLVLITGNTMMQSVRERIPELAVLKTIGFRDSGVLMLVLSESVLLCVLAAIVGVLLASGLAAGLRSVLPNVTVGGSIWGAAMAVAFVLALVVGAVPSWRALRLDIVTALQGH